MLFKYYSQLITTLVLSHVSTCHYLYVYIYICFLMIARL